MEHISDVFEFAVSHVDYWDELLTGTDYPEELANEAVALDAARSHIDDCIVAILHAAATSLAATEHNPPFGQHRPQAAATKKNHTVYPSLPTGRRDLYHMGFCLAADDAGKAIRLYPFITVKKSQRDRVRDQLDKAKVKCKPSNFDIWAEGVPLPKGEKIDTVAKEAARQLVELLDKSCSGEKP